MAHYAYVDENNIVTQVIVGPDEGNAPEGFESWEQYFSSKGKGKSIRTSYNTINNEHLNEGTPFRGNFASVGYFYDEDNDVFIPPKPYKAWVLDNSCWCWKAPTPYPEDDGGVMHAWDDDLDKWSPVE